MFSQVPCYPSSLLVFNLVAVFPGAALLLALMEQHEKHKKLLSTVQNSQSSVLKLFFFGYPPPESTMIIEYRLPFTIHHSLPPPGGDTFLWKGAGVVHCVLGGKACVCINHATGEERGNRENLEGFFFLSESRLLCWYTRQEWLIFYSSDGWRSYAGPYSPNSYTLSPNF